MKTSIKIFLTTLLVFLATVSLTGKSFSFSIPDPSDPEFYLDHLGGIPSASLHGDFLSYSLPFLAIEYDAENGGGTGPKNPYYVVSTPGAIKNGIVLATGASGKPVNNNPNGMDNAYPTPNAGSNPIFSTGTTADPTGDNFQGDGEDTWDVEIGALLGYLGRDDKNAANDSKLIFFWNNNQEKSSGALAEDLFGWAKVTLIDTAKKNPLTPISLYFQDDRGTVGSFDDFTNRANPGDFVFSPGAIGVDVSAGNVTFDKASADYWVDHNLGANQAAYAIYSSRLDAGLEGWLAAGYDTLQFDIRLAELNNGYEQLFILKQDEVTNTPNVPEPASLLLLGSGLAGLALNRKRNKK